MYNFSKCLGTEGPHRGSRRLSSPAPATDRYLIARSRPHFGVAGPGRLGSLNYRANVHGRSQLRELILLPVSFFPLSSSCVRCVRGAWVLTLSGTSGESLRSEAGVRHILDFSVQLVHWGGHLVGGRRLLGRCGIPEKLVVKP